ncbi:MAG: beta-galactosidase [Firmicutes bacterium]|nr:beta-galactosidase [Bacillota bacterium]
MDQDTQLRVIMTRGYLTIDGMPTFLLGGEVHYFRLNPDEWQPRVRAMREAGMNTVGCYIPWLWHEPEERFWDFEGKTHPRRNLIRFLEICQSEKMWVFVRPGPYVMAELAHEGIPGWVAASYPDVVAMTRDGQPHPTGVVSYRHPVYLSLARRWLQAVSHVLTPFLIDAGGPVILWQLDNEVGMLHWVSNQADYHPLVVERFQQESASHKADNALARYWEWQTFQQRERRDYLKALQDEVFDRVRVPFVVNVHGFRDFYWYGRGIDYPIGLAQLALAPELENATLTGDFYPGKVGFDNYHDLVLSTLFTTALNGPDRLAYSAEFQSGRLADRPRLSKYDLGLATRLVIAHGLNGLNYYMFSGGDNPDGIGSLGRRHDWQAVIAADGSYRPSYDTVRHLGSVLRTVGSALAASENVVDVTVGFYSPYYLTDTIPADLAHDQVLERLIHDRTRYHFDGIYRILTDLSVPMNAIAVKEGSLDPENTPVLWMATTPYMDAETLHKLMVYVEDGGHLIVGPDIPRFDLAGHPLTEFAHTFKLDDIVESSESALVRALDIDSVLVHRLTTFAPPPLAQVLARVEATGKPVAASWPWHKGRVTVIGMGLTGDWTYQNEVVDQILDAVGVTRRLKVTPAAVHATIRQGPSGTFISLINPGDEDCHVEVLSPLLPEALTLTALGRQGVLLPIDLKVSDGITIRYSTAELVGLEVAGDALTIQVHAVGKGHLSLQSLSPLYVSTGALASSRTERGQTVVSWTTAGIHAFTCVPIETFHSTTQG